MIYMPVSRGATSSLTVVLALSVGAAMLVSPRGVDRVRTARAGTQRLDSGDAADTVHSAADDHTPAAPATLVPGHVGQPHQPGPPGRGTALLSEPYSPPAPAFARVPVSFRPDDLPHWQPRHRPSDRAPPHA